MCVPAGPLLVTAALFWAMVRDAPFQMTDHAGVLLTHDPSLWGWMAVFLALWGAAVAVRAVTGFLFGLLFTALVGVGLVSAGAAYAAKRLWRSGGRD